MKIFNKIKHIIYYVLFRFTSIIYWIRPANLMWMNQRESVSHQTMPKSLEKNVIIYEQIIPLFQA